MTELEALTAERDALKAKNADLTEQTKQLIGDLSRYRGGAGAGGAGKDEALSGPQRVTLPDGTTGYVMPRPLDKRPNATLPPMARKVFDKMSPWDQQRWATGGGRIANG